nr:serine/threonine protein kinase [Mycobacterium sp. Marseille-P9652]
MTDRRTARRVAAVAVLLATLALAPLRVAAADPADPGNPGNPANPGDMNALIAALSKGYNANNCTPQNLSAGQLASLACGQSPDPAGPAQANYVLFDSPEHLAGAFKASLKDHVLTGCGNMGQSPTTWHGGSGGDSGQVACGTFRMPPRSSGQRTRKACWVISAEPAPTPPRSTSGG